MSLGSRISNRGKAAIASACLASSAPREPLLFLYPLWARKSSTSTQTPASPSQRKAHIRLPSPSQNDDNEHASTALSKRVYIRFKKTKKDGPTSEARGSRNAKSELVRFTTPKASVLRKLFSVRQSAEATALYNLRRRKAYQEARRIQRGADLPDWRVILATLLEHTPDAGRWLEKAVSILVPGNSAEELILGVDDNLWTIVYQHGCSIAFQSQEQETLDRRFLLSGPINGIVKTAGAILEVAPTVLIESTTNDFDIPAQISDMKTKSDSTQIVTAAEHANPILEAKENSRVRRSMVERRVKFLMTMNAAEVPRPEIWTVASFNDFVQYLTSAEMPNHLHRLMYDQRKDHIETVIEVLSSIFTDPKCRHAISRKAYNTAMQYFVKTNRIADARCLFVHMEIIKFPMDVETFNILLRGAAKNNDLSNFQLILNLMLRRNHTPNADTFVAFMRVFTDIRIKSYIVSAMDKKQLLNHKSALKEACECLVMDEIELSLQNNQTEEKFMAQMDSRYGPDWLTVASGNRIIHALGSRWLISRCWAFVMEMKARFIEPDNVSLNTILNHCKHMKNLEGAVEVIKNWPEDAQFGLPLDQMSYHALFEMAWRLRMHNVARVVWKYACLNVATTARMRTLVYNSVKVGVGLNMVPSRGLTRRIRSTSKPTQSELVAEGNEDYQRLLEAVAETMDQTSDNPPAVEAEKHRELSAELAVIEENTTMISSEIRLLSPSSTELNHFGHVSNPNNVAKMFNRTAGLFITGIDFFAIHPMECESLYLENTSSLPSSAFIPSNPPLFKRGKQHSTLYPRIAQAPSLGSIMASTLSTVHLAESQPVAEGTSNWSGFNKFEKISVVERQMERDRAVWQNWQPAKDFKEDLEDAYKRDMEWRELENFEDARSLDWMLERKVDVFVERRGSHQFIKRWS